MLPCRPHPARNALVLLTFTLLGACSVAPASGLPSAVEADPSGAPPTPSEVADASLMGQSCSMGTNPGGLAGVRTKDCGEGVCIADARDGIDAYCSVDCSLKRCPDGWTCEAATIPNPDWVCTRPPSACGDGVVDDGEGCDDGNVADGDGCSAACQPSPQAPNMQAAVNLERLTIDGVDAVPRGRRGLRASADFDALECDTFAARTSPLSDDRVRFELSLRFCSPASLVEAYVSLDRAANQTTFRPLASYVITSTSRATGAVEASWQSASFLNVEASTWRGDGSVEAMKGVFSISESGAGSDDRAAASFELLSSRTNL